MSRKGGLMRVEPRAGSFKPPLWGERAIGKRIGTPPRKRPLAGRPGAEKSKSPGSVELPSDGKSEGSTTTVSSSR